MTEPRKWKYRSSTGHRGPGDEHSMATTGDVGTGAMVGAVVTAFFALTIVALLVYSVGIGVGWWS